MVMGDVLKNVAQSPGEKGSFGSMVVPGASGLALIGILTYHHATQDGYDHTMSHFLAIVFLQMFPLIALKMKIYACGDRLSLVPRVLVKTLLMHLILAVFRMAPEFFRKNQRFTGVQFLFDASAFVTCFIILKQVFNYKFSLRCIVDEREVRSLCTMAVLAAAATEFGIYYLPESWMSRETLYYVQDQDMLGKIIFTSANYIDVVAFVPVVWTLYRVDSDDDSSTGTQVPQEARKEVLLFFFFVVGFYSWDDVIDPIRTLSMQYSLAIMAHGAHYVLLLDFACFFIFQVWAPSSSKGEQLQGLLEAGFEEDD
jgi:hypothetical protein|eukprot:TRINITY_DN50693_c0_g1_i1.p1 TRINITY_DN50693_c0_g1~~TRINITY_DN50693_c0_g1_i1.p1  ORF type:complete len:328 (-),score=53.10 TRINITY_DN50693_c0_g1_i1:138-1073(-)